jgi:hypothetical protein
MVLPVFTGKYENKIFNNFKWYHLYIDIFCHTSDSLFLGNLLGQCRIQTILSVVNLQKNLRRRKNEGIIFYFYTICFYISWSLKLKTFKAWRIIFSKYPLTKQQWCPQKLLMMTAEHFFKKYISNYAQISDYKLLWQLCKSAENGLEDFFSKFLFQKWKVKFLKI